MIEQSLKPLAGKTAFVVGGSSGINLGIAQGMAEAGAQVALMSRSYSKVSAAIDHLKDLGHTARGLTGDVRDYAAVEQAFAALAEDWTGIDIVVSGAAGNFVASADQMSSNAFLTVIEIDLLGTFNVFRASRQHLRCPGASLIAISAGLGVQPTAGQVHACAAKAGVNMVTKCLALEWGTSGIRVNAISPGPISGTEGMARLTPSAAAAEALAGAIPLGTYGEKRDIADLAVFLSSNAARYITGTVIDCDGGLGLTGSPRFGGT